MPEQLSIAAFVFGAVLILLSLVGGGFKLFGAEVTGTAGKLARTTAFVLGGMLLAFGLLREEWSRAPAAPPPEPRTTAPASHTEVPPPTRQVDAPPVINVQGTWRDHTWGIVSQITQQGESYRFVSWGPSCLGGTFESTGSGTIIGNAVESRYEARLQSTIRSEGHCSGTVSADGLMTSTCFDSVCGRFTSSAVRQ